MRKYRLVAKKGEGTFSEVLKAQNVKDGKYHAIKCMKNRFENIDQVNNLREIQALRRLSPNEHVITLEEVLYDQPTGRLALVFELMDGNLYEIIKGRKHYLKPAVDQGLHVAANEVIGPHAQEGNFPPRHQTREHPGGFCQRGWTRTKTRRLWLLPRYLLQAAVHRVHIYPVVPRTRVSAHGRVLRP